MRTAKALLLVFLILTLICGTIAFAQPSIVWQKCLGGSNKDKAYSIQQTSDGGLIIAGFTESDDGDVGGYHGRSDYWVVKLDSSGDIEWQKSLGGRFGDYAYFIQQTVDSEFIAAGKSYSNDGDVSGNHGSGDYWVVKLNSSGDTVWQKCLGGSGTDAAYSIQQTLDGGFIVAGESGSIDGDVRGNHGMWDYWIVKLDSIGDIIWQKSLGGGDEDKAYSIQQTLDGGFIVAGESKSNDSDVSGWHGGFDGYGNPLPDYWVVKLNSAGDIEWQRCLGGSGADVAYFIQQTSDSGFIIAGWSSSNDGDVSGNHGGIDYWVVKLDFVGNIEWQRCLGGSGADIAYSIQQTIDGGFIVAGYTESNDGDVSGNHGSADYWIIKLSHDVGINKNETASKKLKLSVSPNPFNSSCIITAPSGAKVEIYDLRGRLISKGIQPFAESQGKRTFIWQPDKTIRSGVYIVKATMENGRQKVKRVVLVR